MLNILTARSQKLKVTDFPYLSNIVAEYPIFNNNLELNYNIVKFKNGSTVAIFNQFICIDEHSELFDNIVSSVINIPNGGVLISQPNKRLNKTAFFIDIDF